ncbi:MAG: hypothetical protein IKA09_12630 [Lachnospiraceae bacterium]|nr:hypothetical protein [Lachnospiraceae bacterium]
MKRKSMSKIFAFLLAVLLCITNLSMPGNTVVASAEGTTSGKWTDTGNCSASLSGTGTSTDPYIISNAADLAFVAKSYNTTTATNGKYFKVADNITEINLSAHEWVPITNFQGNFDGNGVEISGLKIGSSETAYSGTTNVGLFGRLDDGAVVKNLTLNVSIYTNLTSGSAHHMVGGIAGICSGAVTVDGCTVKGSINATAGITNKFLRVGGIVGTGQNGVVITNCINETTISATDTILNAYAGGIAGYLQQNSSSCNKVVNCCNFGSVTVTASKSGQIACGGGIVGVTTTSGGASAKNNYILNCYNAGSVSASGSTSTTGSIVGQAQYCNLGYLYWLENTAAKIIGTKSNSSEGTDASTTAMSEAALQALSTTLNNNITTLSSEHTSLSLQTWNAVENGYPILSGPSVGGEEDDEEGSGSGSQGGNTNTVTFWTNEGNYSASLSGTGTSADPYIISNAADLAFVAKSFNTKDATSGKYFKVADNITEIDLSAHEWVPITDFSGNFDGNGATIKGMVIGTEAGPNTSGTVGMFATIWAGAVVKNVTVDVNIYTEFSTEGGQHFVGGLVGTCYGNLDNCRVKGTVQANSTATTGTKNEYSVGGIAGQIRTRDNTGVIISNCINEASVIGSSTQKNRTYRAAGLTGCLRGDDSAAVYMVNCVNLGTVTAKVQGDALATGQTLELAGISSMLQNATAGSSKANVQVINCYSAGSVTTIAAKGEGSILYGGIAANSVSAVVVSDSYWMTGSVSTDSNKGGTEKTETDMKQDAFKDILNLGASLYNGSTETNVASNWDMTSGNYPLPTGIPAAAGYSLKVNNNSERLGTVTTEVKAPGETTYATYDSTKALVSGTEVRLTWNVSPGCAINSIMVNDAFVDVSSLTDNKHTFTITNSTTVDITFIAETPAEVDPIYVKPDAVSGGNGSLTSPYNSLEDAKTAISTLLATSPNVNVTVYLMGGTYVLEDTLSLGSTEASFGRVTFKNYENEIPVITSGHKIPVGSFEEVEEKNYYVYQLPETAKTEGSYPAFRDLLVDGERATLAKTKEYTYVKSFKNEVLNSSKVEGCDNGLYISKEALDGITNENLNGVELGHLVEWKSQIFHLGSIVGEDASGEMEIQLKQAEWDKFYETDTTKRSLTGRSYWLQNHIRFLDEPGEFYYDQANGTIYYYPYVGQNMDTANIEYAVLDVLISLENAANITFDGITFTGTTANYITENGLATELGCTTLNYKWDPGDSVPVAAILGNTAEGIYIENCTFEELSGSAVVLTEGIKNLQVTGNVMKDLAMAGVLVGKNQREWNKDGIIGSSEEVTINNNYITNIGLNVYGAPAIRVARSKNLKIQHNTIIHVPYSGIMVGYGWEAKAGATEAWYTNLINADISYNYIEDFLYKINDGGAIYTCGANAFIENTATINSIHHNYIRSGAHNGTYTGIYHDGSASNWHTYENVVDDLKSNKGPMFFQDDVQNQYTHNIIAENNYTTVSAITQKGDTDANGKPRNIVLQNNTVFADRSVLSEAAADIMKGAGLEEKYKDIVAPMDVELRISDNTMHYVVDKNNTANTKATMSLTNNSNEERTFTLSLIGTLPNYVSCQFKDNGVITLKSGETVSVEAEFIITDKEKLPDSEDYIIGFEVTDTAGRVTKYPRAITVAVFDSATREIAYGTPVVDAKMDDKYKESYRINFGNVFYPSTSAKSDLAGYCYLLWDENYLYCYAVVNESTVMSGGIDLINANNPNSIWKNDAIETYIYTTLRGSDKITKFAGDAFGIKRYGNDLKQGDEKNAEFFAYHNSLTWATAFTYQGEIIEGYEIKNPTAGQMASTEEQPVDGYVMEMVLPLTECTDLATAGTPVAGDKIRFQVQNNDYQSGDSYVVALHNVEDEYVLGGKVTSFEPPVASIGGTNYTSLEKAIDAVKEGGTITLIEDVTATNDVTINSGITIDLNGNSLNMGTNYLISYGDVVDNSTDKSGRLKISSYAANETEGVAEGTPKAKLAADNSHMPVYIESEDAYMLASMKPQATVTAKETDYFTSVSRPSFGATQVEKLKNGATAAKLQFIIRLDWTKDGISESQEFYYSDSLVQTVYGQGKAFSVTITGLTNYVDNMMVTEFVKADLGVVLKNNSFSMKEPSGK